MDKHIISTDIRAVISGSRSAHTRQNHWRSADIKQKMANR